MKRDGRIGWFLRGWREDYIFQTLISAAASFGCTALFALYNGYLGLWHRSVWHGSICVFYLLLMPFGAWSFSRRSAARHGVKRSGTAAAAGSSSSVPFFCWRWIWR